MRIVATSDTHFPVKKEMIPDGDVLIVAGDIMLSGTVQEWHSRIEALAALPHKTKLLVAGNHDRFIEDFTHLVIPSLEEGGITLIGYPSRTGAATHAVGDLRILGLPFVTGLPGWAFNYSEEWIIEHLEYVVGRVDIVVSHSPPAGILDGPKGGHHYGIQAYNKLLRDLQPRYWICGHVHSQYGVFDTGKCKIYNVCMCDEEYKQVNPPVVIDI